MNRKILLAFILNFIILLSIYTLFGLVTKRTSQLDDTSKIRFLYFIGVHVIFFISIIIMVRIRNIYSYTILGFFNCLAASLGLFICQQKVKSIQALPEYNFRKFSGTSEKLELTFLNIYFLVYMYAIIGLITTGVFISATEIFICWEQHIINSRISKCLTKQEYQQSMTGQDCSICLQQLKNSGEIFTEINICKHTFHENCLIQWIKHNKTCPLDRKNIFEFQQQENGQQLQF